MPASAKIGTTRSLGTSGNCRSEKRNFSEYRCAVLVFASFHRIIVLLILDYQFQFGTSLPRKNRKQMAPLGSQRGRKKPATRRVGTTNDDSGAKTDDDILLLSPQPTKRVAAKPKGLKNSGIVRMPRTPAGATTGSTQANWPEFQLKTTVVAEEDGSASGVSGRNDGENKFPEDGEYGKPGNDEGGDDDVDEYFSSASQASPTLNMVGDCLNTKEIMTQKVSIF